MTTSRDELLRAASHALRSYEYGNSATDLAKAVADKIDAALAAPTVEGWKWVPVEPSEEQWSGLARAIMMWLDMSDRYPPRSLLEHLDHSGHDIPQWLRDELEMQSLDHSMSKGTRCAIIYKAMLSAVSSAPQQASGWIAVSERLPEHENDVLIHHVLGDDTRAYDVACYIGGAWVFPWGKEISPHWVTHWQPLPAAPANASGKLREGE